MLEGQAETKQEIKIYSNSSVESYATDKLLQRYSSWSKLTRAVAWLMRFKSMLLKRESQFEHYLSVKELQEAASSVIRYVQCKTLENPAKLKDLQRLSPTNNSKGLICIGGRLKNAPVPEETKHPILLPHHHVSELIIRHYHINAGHFWCRMYSC